MIRGSTPTHTFDIPIDTSLIKEVKIIYAQADKQVFCKRTGDCVFDGTKIKTTLTQEETFMFDCTKMVQIQLRVLTLDGKVPPIEVIEVIVKKCLDNEVLV
jgi:hypothetical protein